MAGWHAVEVVPVLGDVVDIPYMAGWPALLVPGVVLLVLGLRNPYRNLMGGRASGAADERASAETSNNTKENP